MDLYRRIRSFSYRLCRGKAEEKIRKVVEGDRIESDHVPLEVELEAELEGTKDKKRRKEKDIKEIERSNWSEEGIAEYREKCEEWNCTETENEDIWRELKEKVKSSIPKVKKKIIPWKFGKREWHSKEWKREKRYLRRMFRELKKGRIDWKEYARIRKNYKTWCKEEKKKHEKEEEEKINNIRKRRHGSI